MISNAFFPPGSEINGYVIELFLSHRNGTTGYLAVNREQKRFLLAVYDFPGTIALENDIDLWTGIQHENVVSDITFYTQPYTMAVMPCVSGLTLEEFFMAGNTFSEEEALDFLCRVSQVLTYLQEKGCVNWHISGKNLFVMPDHRFLIQRDCAADNTSQLPATSFRKLTLEVLEKVPAPLSPHGEILQEDLRKLPAAAQLADIKAVLTQKKKKSALFSGAGYKMLCGLLLLALISVAGIKIFLFQRKKENAAPRITTQTLKATHHSRGPVVHAAPAENASREKEPEKKPPQPLKTALPVPPKRPQPIKRPVRKAAVKKIPRRKAMPVRRPAAPVIRKPQALVADAARRGNLRDLRGLIAAGHDVHLRDNSGKTALEYAASANWPTMIELLHKAGAKITPAVLQSAGNTRTRRYLETLLNPPPPRVRPSVSKAVTPVKRFVVPNTRGWKKPDKKGWHLTLETAVIQARPQKKKIFVLFTGADWCGPCKALASQVLSSSDFRRLGRKMELVYINFPRKEKQPPAQKAYNEKLRNDLRGGGGVPTALILDCNGKPLGRIRGYRPKESYIKELKQFVR